MRSHLGKPQLKQQDIFQALQPGGGAEEGLWSWAAKGNWDLMTSPQWAPSRDGYVYVLETGMVTFIPKPSITANK